MRINSHRLRGGARCPKRALFARIQPSGSKSRSNNSGQGGRSPFIHLAALLMSLGAAHVLAAEGGAFKPTRDHEVQPGVPQGKVIPMGTLKSKTFPDTTRDWWIYVPAHYKPDGTAALMVFQDAQNYINLRGVWRVP